MDNLEKFCCQNKFCPDYGQYGLDNLTVCGKFGKKDNIRLLYCRTCKTRFSERKGSVIFGLRLSDEKLADVLNHLAEGCGVRQTARLVGVHRDTVSRIKKVAGVQAQELYLELVNGKLILEESSARRNIKTVTGRERDSCWVTTE